MNHDSTRDDRNVQAVYTILIVGGVVGGVLVLGSIIGAAWWWNPMISWIRDGELGQVWKPIAGVFALLFGQGIMFGAFQSARRFERTDPVLRRVMYGFNAVLQLQLLLLLLVLANIFIHVRLPLPFDTTEGGFFSLSDKAKQIVGALERPVQVYLLLEPGDPAYSDMKTVLTQLQQVNPKYFRVEDVATVGNRNRVAELQRKFTLYTGRSDGLIIAVGEPPEGEFTPWPQSRHAFIPSGNLSSTDFSETGQKREFTGEVRLIQELVFLAEDKKRPVVYVTQGHGEPELGDRTQEGMATLAEALTRANYDVQPLTAPEIDSEKFAVPPDADLVAIVGPRRAMGDVLPALRKFMNPTDPKAKKGKLLVLFGPTSPDKDRNFLMRDIGLEQFLGEFGVFATNEQIYTFSFSSQLMRENDLVPVAGVRGATESRHPILGLFKSIEEPPFWQGVRRIEPGPNNDRKLQVEALLGTVGITWVETDTRKNPQELVRAARMRDEAQIKRLASSPRMLGVAVSEAPAEPNSKQGPTPRLMVFGCSSFATNRYQLPAGNNTNFDVIRGSIDWLRERSGNVGIEPKSHRYYEMPKQVSEWKLFFLPLSIMVFGIGGLGLIVWNIRRDSRT